MYRHSANALSIRNEKKKRKKDTEVHRELGQAGESEGEVLRREP